MKSITGGARRELKLFKAKYSKRTGTAGNYKYEYDTFRSDKKFRQSLASNITASFINSSSPPEKDYSSPGKMLNWLSKDHGGARPSSAIKDYFGEAGKGLIKGTVNFKGKKVNHTFEAAESGLVLSEIRGKLDNVLEGLVKGNKKKSKQTLKMINDKKLAPLANVKGGKTLMAALSIGKDGTIFIYDDDKGTVIPIAGSVGELVSLLKKRSSRKKGLFSFGKKK